MSIMILGTCSLCHGPVTVNYLSSSLPPEPVCRRCGAVPESPYGPVIEMVPRRMIAITTTNTTKVD